MQRLKFEVKISFSINYRLKKVKKRHYKTTDIFAGMLLTKKKLFIKVINNEYVLSVIKSNFPSVGHV